MGGTSAVTDDGGSSVLHGEFFLLPFLLQHLATGAS